MNTKSSTTESPAKSSQKSSQRDLEPTGFAVKTIMIGIVWTVLLGTAIGVSIKYGIELSRLVSTNVDQAPHRGPIRVGVYNWAGFYPLVVAKDRGLFAKHGLNVELVRAESVGELNDLIRTGRTQVSVGVLADFIVLRRMGTPIRMMVATDYSLADVILGSARLRNAKDLAGKNIGLSELNSFAQYFVVRSLELAGVNTRNINFYTVPPERVPAAILKGEIDAGHTWNPHLADGLSRGLKIVLSTANTPRLVLDGIVFRKEVAEDIHIPTGITRAFFEALAIQKSDPVAFAESPAKYFEISKSQTQKFIDEDVRFADLDENIRLFDAGGILRKEASAIAQFFAQRGMGGNDFEIKDLIDDSVIRQLEDERAIGEAPSPATPSSPTKSTALQNRLEPPAI